MKTTTIDIGNQVICDSCNADWTEIRNDWARERTFIFGSYGYCPDCAPRMAKTIKSYNEEQFIRAFSKKGEAFCDFILRVRGGNNAVIISGDIMNVDEWADAFEKARTASKPPTPPIPS